MFLIAALVIILLCACALSTNNEKIGEILLPIIVFGFIITVMLL